MTSFPAKEYSNQFLSSLAKCQTHFLTVYYKEQAGSGPKLDWVAGEK
jgi:hypothetical protein